MSKAPQWTERDSGTFTTPGPRLGMTIELRRSNDNPLVWEGRFAFSIATGTGTKTFRAPDAETARRLAWAVAEDWFSGT